MFFDRLLLAYIVLNKISYMTYVSTMKQPYNLLTSGISQQVSYAITVTREKCTLLYILVSC